jgi:hypothetical protein
MSHGHYSDRIPYSGHVLSASTHLPRDSRHQLRAPSQTSITPNEQRRRTRITPRAPLDNPVSSRSTLHDVSASAPSEGPSRGHGRNPGVLSQQSPTSRQLLQSGLVLLLRHCRVRARLWRLNVIAQA